MESLGGLASVGLGFEELLEVLAVLLHMNFYLRRKLECVASLDNLRELSVFQKFGGGTHGALNGVALDKAAEESHQLLLCLVGGVDQALGESVSRFDGDSEAHLCD